MDERSRCLVTTRPCFGSTRRACGSATWILSSRQSPSTPYLRNAVGPVRAAPGPHTSKAAHTLVSHGSGPVKSTYTPGWGRCTFRARTARNSTLSLIPYLLACTRVNAPVCSRRTSSNDRASPVSPLSSTPQNMHSPHARRPAPISICGQLGEDLVPNRVGDLPQPEAVRRAGGGKGGQLGWGHAIRDVDDGGSAGCSEPGRVAGSQAAAAAGVAGVVPAGPSDHRAADPAAAGVRR